MNPVELVRIFTMQEAKHYDSLLQQISGMCKSYASLDLFTWYKLIINSNIFLPNIFTW